MEIVKSKQDGELLTREQVGVYLHLCENSVDKLPIPKIKLKRRVLFRKSAVDSFLQKQEIAYE